MKTANIKASNQTKPGTGENNQNHTEINPAKPANNTEVDLDKSKTKTYPEKSAPEQH